MSLKVRILISSFTLIAIANANKSVVDYTKYNVPLFEQIKDRIKNQIIIKLGKDRIKSDRYFITPFGYEDEGNHANQSHTFATVVKIDPDRNVEHFTISWLPDRFKYDTNLCVFKGKWLFNLDAVLDPSKNLCEHEVGHNFNLKETLNFALPTPEEKAKSNFTRYVGMWGPYEIKEPLFKAGVGRKNFLDSAKVEYKADDRLTRLNPLIAFNCFHAISSLDVAFPKGGFLDTGFKMWGLNGTKHAIVEYKEKEKERLKKVKNSEAWVIGPPLDEDKDVYGFVYVDNSGRKLKNPFKNSSAFYK